VSWDSEKGDEEWESKEGGKRGRLLFWRPCFLNLLDKLLVLYVSAKSQVIG
jgi:hypothetical protein